MSDYRRDERRRYDDDDDDKEHSRDRDREGRRRHDDEPSRRRTYDSNRSLSPPPRGASAAAAQSRKRSRSVDSASDSSRSPSPSPASHSRPAHHKSKKKSKKKKKHRSHEESDAAKLRRKEEKRLRKLKEMGWDDEQLQYTNEDNPYGDPNLHSQFVWKKKEDLQREAGMSVRELRERERARRDENRRELEKVKKRRQEREDEMKLREEEKAMAQREADTLTYSEWQRKDVTFELEQMRERSRIRVREGRARPIDVLARCAEEDSDLTEIELNEPHRVFDGLSQADCEELMDDVESFLKLDDNTRRGYWLDVQTVCADELRKRQLANGTSAPGATNAQVRAEVGAILAGKTTEQLHELRGQITDKIEGGQAANVSFWESLVEQLDVRVALSRLRDRHERVLRRKLAELLEQGRRAAQRGEQEGETRSSELVDVVEMALEKTRRRRELGDAAVDEADEVALAEQGGTAEDEEGGAGEGAGKEDGEEEEDDDVVFTEEDLLAMGEGGKLMARPRKSRGGAGGVGGAGSATSDLYELPLIPFDGVDATALSVALDPVEDAEALRRRRAAVQARVGSASGGVGGAKKRDVLAERMSAVEQRFMADASRDMDDDESVLTDEAVAMVPSQPQQWHEKYRPRKPRYFNRVHTGFEWNMYNRTHYDKETPPPKVIQGYKFNLFYGDLIDKSKAPTYHITPHPSDPNLAILRFSAGPPYEDIAFTVANRPWEYSHRHGHRSEYKGGVFYLWFRFRRERYRR